MACVFHPGENRIGKRQIPGIRLHEINENAGVESDPALAQEESS
jgi:hypothetical protein